MRPGPILKCARAVALLLAVVGCSTAQNPFIDVEWDDGGNGEGGEADVPPGEDGADRPEGADGDADADADGDDVPPPACTTDLECNDLLDCTSDSCDTVAGTCVNEPIDAACDDGNACTTGERCDPATGCTTGTLNDCSDSIPCTRDVCEPFTGSCSHSPDHGLCEAPEMCYPDRGGCATPPPCTSDAECSDGDLCNGVEVCNGELGCSPGTAVTCPDAIDCTRDSCDPMTGACAHTPDDSVCDNRNLCDGAETCDPTLGCQRGTPLNCSDSVSCTDDLCDPATGACSHTANASRCDDGRYCNGAEVCDAAVGCTSGPVPACSDGIMCTVDRCDAATDTCASTASDALCGDGQYCNGAETCSAAVGCVAGTAPTCDDGRACSTDRCDSAASGGAGACVSTSPDRDGDTYGDIACSGNDCNDSNPAVHPGAAEACNAIDDNCNGTTDEGYGCIAGSAQSCTVGSCTGSQTCSASCAWSACTVSATEVCNGVDDNCNGTADEGFGCIFGRTQSCWVGSCGGTQTCVAGCSWGACTVTATEICNGVDDNCNGSTDEGYTCIPGRTQSCWVGSCGGTQTCNSSCGWGSCTVTAVESCNGIDDNCNGSTDETFSCRMGATQGCTNSCGAAGTQTCAAGSCTWGACCGSEVCGNSCDDDCDGLVNEGCTCTGDTCACTLTVGGSGGTYSGSTSGMTNDYTSSCGGGGTGPDVVYSFTPSTGGTWQIDTIGSGFDTVLHLRSGGCPGSESYCDDDAGGGLTSLITATLSAGVTYYIVVDGYGGGSGTYTLHVIPGGACTPSAADTCAGATCPIAASGSYSGNTCSYWHDYTPSTCAYASSNAYDAVYGLTVSYYREVQITMTGSTWDTVLYVRSGSCTGTEVACNDDYGTTSTSYIDTWLAAGTYYVILDGYYDSTYCGSYSLSVTFL